MKCASYIPALREASNRTVQKRASPGERIMASLFPSRGTGWPGGWSQDRLEQVLHYRQWTYVAVDLICSKIASITPNLAYVVDAPKPGITQKASRRSPSYFGQGQWISDGGHSFLTMGAYRSKALSVVKPHEELEPLENDHRLRELVDNPNPVDTSFDLLYELQMFDELCGVDYLWAVPNRWGMPAELWVIPSHWVWPRTGGGRIPDGGLSHISHRLMEPQWDPGQEVGDHVRYGTQYVDPNMAHADELIHYYEVRPWGGMGSAGILRLPPNEVIMTRWKSPINKIDGYSKLAAAAQWIDSEESITKSRWSQFQNVARPEFWIELGPGYEDPDDDRIARTEAKIASKIQGEYNYGKPLITPPGSKVTPLSFNPGQMAYQESEEQIRDMILSTFRVPPSAVGIVKEMTYGSILATLGSLCTFCLNPRLVMRGQALTKHLASKWDSDQTPAWSNGASKVLDVTTNGNGETNGYTSNGVNGSNGRGTITKSSAQLTDIRYKYTGGAQGGRSGRRKVRLWWDDCVPADPSQVNSDIAEDRAHYAITPDEVRAIRGRHPYKFWGSDPIAQGPTGIMPLPLNTGRDLSKYAELLKPLTEQQQGGGGQGEGMPGGEQESGSQDNPPAALLGGNQEGEQEEEEGRVGESQGGEEEGLQPEEGGEEAEQPEQAKPQTTEGGGQRRGEGSRPINRLTTAATPPKRPNGPPSKLISNGVTKSNGTAVLDMAPSIDIATKALDSQGGEEPAVSLQALAKADFITLSKAIEGTNCSNCLFNTDGICQHSTIKGQPVNERNCCAFWDSPDTLREWKRKGLI